MKIGDELLCVNNIDAAQLKVNNIYTIAKIVTDKQIIGKTRYRVAGKEAYFLNEVRGSYQGDAERPFRESRFSPLHYNASAISELLEERKVEKG